MEKGKGSSKRFGVRYGRTVRQRLEKVENQYRGQKLICPYCSYKQVKRVAAGIWNCAKCNIKFASKAYTIAKTKREGKTHG